MHIAQHQFVTPYQMQLNQARKERLARMQPTPVAHQPAPPAQPAFVPVKPKPKRDLIVVASPKPDDYASVWEIPRPITIGDVRNFKLKRTAGTKKLARRAVHWASVLTGVKENLILSYTRKAPVIHARRIAIWLIYNHYSLRCRVHPCMPTISLPAIGHLMGGLDHTTVLHALRRMQEHYPKRVYIAQDGTALGPRKRND